jgi:elongation factor G
MAAKISEKVRAIALVGPAGAGKTTLAQALAALSPEGRMAPIPPPGPSHETAFLPIDFMGDHYVLMDTPGAVDFSAELDFTLPAVDLALVVADPEPDKAVLVQPCLKELERLGVPHALFINKIDQAHVRIRDLLEALQTVSATPRWRGNCRSGTARRFPASSISRSNARSSISPAKHRSASIFPPI